METRAGFWFDSRDGLCERTSGVRLVFVAFHRNAGGFQSGCGVRSAGRGVGGWFASLAGAE